MRTLVPGSIGGVIFDMDGVLFDTEKEWLDCYLVAAREFGFTYGVHQVCMSAIGRTNANTMELFMTHFGATYPFEPIKTRARELRNEHRQKNGITVKRGVREIVSMLREKTVPYAIASSSHTEHIVGNLQHTALHNLFEHMIGGDQVIRGKPDPEIFLKAAALIGVEPTQCIVLEDSVNGVLAAHHAGMIPILVPDIVDHPEESKARAHAILESLLHVRDYLAKIL